MMRRRTTSTLFPYTTLFRSFHITQNVGRNALRSRRRRPYVQLDPEAPSQRNLLEGLSEEGARRGQRGGARSEEHTSELQSQSNLVCRLLLEKKKKGRRPRTQ